jgi:hypothetical protein
MPEPIHDSSSLEFRQRLDRHPRRVAPRGHNAPWIVFAVIAAIGFVVLIRTLLDRTAGTAAPAVELPSRASASVPAGVQEYPPVVASTPMVYRCESRSGAISLQSQPCAPGERTTRAVPAPPDIEPVRRPYTEVRPPAGPVNYGQINTVHAGNNERAQRERECAQARRSREDTLERVGLKRTYDLLQRLDEMVRRACSGR